MEITIQGMKTPTYTINAKQSPHLFPLNLQDTKCGSKEDNFDPK